MKHLLMSGIGLSLLVLTACNITTPDVTPTSEILITDTPTIAVSPSLTPSLTPSITPTREVVDVPVIVASPLPTDDNLPPAPIVTPTATQGPCEVTVQEGETLIMATNRNLCGNQMTNGLIAAIVAFNENITNADFVSPGLKYFVPLPSPTPIPEGADMTATKAKEDNVSEECIGIGVLCPRDQIFGCYTVVEGDTIVSIADQYNTTLEILSPLNQNLGWGGCDFTNPSGGPNCSPNLRVGECVQVPFPTSTPVPTGTPSGNETATPTPTHEAARVISPPEGSTASQRVILEWVSVGILRPNEVYLIDIEDRTSGTSDSYISRTTRRILPDSLIPSDGQTHTIGWRVRVARDNSDGTYTVVGGTGDWHSFLWRSR